MSGSGKSSALEELGRLGFRVVDTDEGDRTTNSYGKSAEQRELILQHLSEVEPRLRRTCTHEIDATQPLADVVGQLAELGREAGA
jgi:dephospho-CoA kinase